MTQTHWWITQRTEYFDPHYVEVREYFAHDDEMADDLIEELVEKQTDKGLFLHNWCAQEVTLKNKVCFVRITRSVAYTEDEMVEAGFIDPPTRFNREAWSDIIVFEEP